MISVFPLTGCGKEKQDELSSRDTNSTTAPPPLHQKGMIWVVIVGIWAISGLCICTWDPSLKRLNSEILLFGKNWIVKASSQIYRQNNMMRRKIG